MLGDFTRTERNLMTVYRYKGFQDRKVVEGLLEVATSQELLEKLAAKKIQVIWYFPHKLISFNRLSFQESLALCTHLEYLLKAGLSLPLSLHHLSQQSSSSLSHLAKMLQKKIEGGFSLSEAMRSEKTFFDPIFIELIKVGEIHGNLAQSFCQIKDYLLWKNKFQKTLVQSLRYPFILFFLLIVLMITLTTFLVPPLQSFLTLTGIEQSLSTRLLLGFTQILSCYGIEVAIGGLGFFTSLFFVTRLKSIKFKWHKALIHLPMVGPFLVKLWIIKISMNLFLLLKSEVFLMQALQVITSQTNNVYLKSVLEKASQQLTQGQSLSDCLAPVQCIPGLMSHFIKAGEQSNNLAESFLNLRDYYSETIQCQIEFLKDFLPTICLVLIGGFLIWMVLGVFYPLYNLSGI